MSDVIAKERFTWRSLGWSLIYFWYFSCALQLLIVVSGHSGTTGLRDSLMYSLLWLVPLFLFPRQTRLINAVLGMVLWAASMIALV